MPDRGTPPEVLRGFPLFPLGIVALPSESVPLHVFEDRYKRMIERCLSAEPDSAEREFGIVWLSDEELKEVGCACEIERVLERMDDGRLNILARGTRPFRLLERQDELPYPAGVVEFLRDPDETEDEGPHEADEVAGAGARDLYRELVEQATDRQLTDEEVAAMSAYEMAGTVEFAVDAKQELLELRSESARLRLLALLLRAAIKRLELIDRAQARAQSNGKVRFG
ncbi:MAG TPA: LON peptidase substrate-binding domain-containing protein [Solirubrobacteraceae bacterium]|nr:LON peptidase substrate-binding domain-containing protein [Solirubrobacteraceae bacterium]